jgi:hypothetical protein
MKIIKSYFLIFNLLSLLAILLLFGQTIINGYLGGTQNEVFALLGAFILNLHPLLSLTYMAIYFFWSEKKEDSFNVKLVLYSPIFYWLLFILLILNYVE